MTPQDKAKELVDKYMNIPSNSNTVHRAKQCAIIACDEIIELRLIEDKDLQETTKEYWQSVKAELLNL